MRYRNQNLPDYSDENGHNDFPEEQDKKVELKKRKKIKVEVEKVEKEAQKKVEKRSRSKSI